MEIVFSILLILGGAVSFSSIFYLKPGVPFASLNPKHWKPVWKQRKYFRGPGYYLMVVGLIWMGISWLGLLIVWLG